MSHFYLTIYQRNNQGRIACANVLSDLYAMGVVDCHNMLMLLAGDLDDFGIDIKDIDNAYNIHAKNVWCCGDGYFGQKKFAEKVRKLRQNVNRDKSA